ncbi:MAG: hypothetical protein U1F37_16460 [Alphaproteobacteria bacterium]
MAQMLSALAMGKAGFGMIEYTAFAGVTAIMVMFIVETVKRYS